MKNLFNSATIFFFLLTGAHFIFAQQISVCNQKKLIEFGWDYPDADYLIAHQDVMNKTPFDGVCFSINKRIMQLMDTTVFKKAYYKNEELKQIAHQHFTDNFIILRGYGSTGPYWFNDAIWNNIVGNMQNLSQAVTDSKSKGILFDTEYYLSNPNLDPWAYNKTIYPDKSFEQVKAEVMQRGMQAMQALQSFCPNIKIISTWIAGLSIDQLKTMRKEDLRQALLPAFIEGMLRGKNGQAEIIDGNESGYWYKSAIDFTKTSSHLRNDGSTFFSAQGNKLYNTVTIAQPIYLDGLLAKAGIADRGYDTATKRNWLANNLKYALATSDEYTWVYCEHVNWWTNQVDDGLMQMFADTKSTLCNIRQQAININNGFGVDDLLHLGVKNNQEDVYDYNPSTNNLQLTFGNELPVSICIYENNTLIEEIKSSIQKKLSVSLQNKYSQKGNLIVIANYRNNETSDAAIVY